MISIIRRRLVSVRRRPRPCVARAQDAFFADPAVVEDDYRRMKRSD